MFIQYSVFSLREVYCLSNITLNELNCDVKMNGVAFALKISFLNFYSFSSLFSDIFYIINEHEHPHY